MSKLNQLEGQFHRAMIDVYEHAKEFDYFANYFKQMLDRYGSVETAKRLLGESQAQEGLFKLWELKALEISVEATVLREEFRALFDERELDEAKRRLDDLDFNT